MSISLEFRNISKSYPSSKLAAVNEVSLKLNEGEILALVGESGSGKSTLLRLAAGLEIPDQGEIYLGDQPIAGPRIWLPPEKRGIGLVFQEGALFPHLTVQANLIYGLHRKSTKDKQSISTQLLNMVGLAGKEKRYPHELSGGERQRLAIIRALAPKPRVLLLDEPFGNLDPALRRTMREEIRELLHELKTTAILVTHDPADSLSVATKIAILKQGQLEQIGTPSEVYRHPQNIYCANLFGPANPIQINGHSVQYYRPEQLQINTESTAGAIECRVSRIHNTGKHQEVLVSPKKPAFTLNADEWLLYYDSEPIHEGMNVWISLK